MLLTAPGLESCISGVILFDETMHQRSRSGRPFPHLLAERGIIPGIKVDLGTVDLALHSGERITQGIDGLRERLVEYRRLGARFTKWRAVLAISDRLPSHGGIAANASLLAAFAALSQEAGLVPIVEPEVLMQGSHDLMRCETVTTEVLRQVFAALAAQQVVCEHMLLKTGMVLSGSTCPDQATDAQVAAATRRCLLRAVPAAVAGIVFLSGGQSSVQATSRLAAICKQCISPWPMSFSFGRALQHGALRRWNGSQDRVSAAQDELYQCAARLREAVTAS
jgi:fructose-bisphosphate aldolase class I